MKPFETDDPSHNLSSGSLSSGGPWSEPRTDTTPGQDTLIVVPSRAILAPHSFGRTSRRHRGTSGRIDHETALRSGTGETAANDLLKGPDDTSGTFADWSPIIVPIATPDNGDRPVYGFGPLDDKEGGTPSAREDLGEHDAPPWERPDFENAPVDRPRRRFRGAVELVALGLIATVVGFGLNRVATTNNNSQAADTSATATTSTAATSSVPPVSALRALQSSVRILAGGPDAMGNGGTAERVLLRRPTSVARIRAGIVFADAGMLRLLRPDGRIEGVEIDRLPENVLIDHVAALTNGRVLAVDESSVRFFVLEGVGSSVVTAVPAASGDIVSPVHVVGDGGGGALIADPGSGSVWRWSSGSAPVRILGGLVAPVHVGALGGGAALVTDRGAGLVLRIDGPNQATVIASSVIGPTSSPATSKPLVVALRSTPIAAVLDRANGVQVLMLDGAISRLALRPAVNDRASIVTEFLGGATSLVADGDATIIVESGERRIRQVVTSEPGRAAVRNVLGETRWPRFNPDALRAKAVVLIDPTGTAVRPDGSVVVADRGANIVWQLNEDGSAERLAGNGTWGNSTDAPDATASSIASPTDVALSVDGTVIFTEPTFGRIRGIRPDGSLVTVMKSPGIDGVPSERVGDGTARLRAGELTVFSPGPVAVNGQGVLIAGDRFTGGLWTITPGGVVPVKGAGPPTKFAFAATERAGSIVAMDPFGKAVRVVGGSVIVGAEGLVEEGEIVRTGTSDGSGVVVAVASDGVANRGRAQPSDDFAVLRRQDSDGPRSARVVSMSSFQGSLFVATNGLRGSVLRIGGDADIPLTSTALGEDQGRGNETNLADPVALDATDDGTLVITDRGGGRVRSLRAGQLGTLAGNGTVDRQNDPKANASGQSLSELRDAQANRNGTTTMVDGSRLLTVDGTGLVVERTVTEANADKLILRSIDQGPDGATLAVADDGRLFRIDAKGATILTTAPALSNVRTANDGTVWGVTNTGRVVRLEGDRFVNVETPRNLAVIACDERDGRLVVVGRDGTVALRTGGEWFRMSPSTTVSADRRTNRVATPRPTDVTVLPDGGVVVADAGRDALLVYRAS